MKNEKLKTIANLFEGNEIRSIWNSEINDYYFSVVDVIYILTNSTNPNDYWYRFKRRMTEEEKSQLSTKCRQLKMQSSDGKFYSTDVLDTEGIFRLIQSIPSSKAEPFKLWLAKLGRERVDETFDPEGGFTRLMDICLQKGYSLEWIETRIKAIINRKKLTSTWKENGIESNLEYAILTNEIYKTWSGMTAREYKKHKNIRKESLRDNMTRVDVTLTNLGEIATEELARKHKPYGLSANKKVAKAGGDVAKIARTDLEKKLGETIISRDNVLNYQYIDDNQQITNEKDKELIDNKK